MAITHGLVMLAATLLMTAWDLARAEDLPPYLKVCSRHDPEFSNCLSRAIDALRPIFAAGDPSRSIPSLEPLELGDLLVADHAGHGRQGVRISATDIVAHGASNFRMEKIRGDFDKLNFYFEVALPRLETTGNYGIEGNILLLPIKGSGPFTGNFTDCIGRATLTGEVIEKEGQKYVHFNDLKIKIKVGKGRLNLKNLFGGDKALGDIINQTINSNFDTLSQDIIPLIEKALSKLFLNIGNQIVSRYTVEQLYPEEV